MYTYYFITVYTVAIVWNDGGVNFSESRKNYIDENLCDSFNHIAQNFDRGNIDGLASFRSLLGENIDR